VIPTVIDTDPGIDDALALLFAWSSPELSVEAVTTVAGNVTIHHASANAWRLSGLRAPARPPILAEGAARPLRRPLRTAEFYHGRDGLGEVEGWPPTPPRAAPDDALAVIEDLARRHGRRLIVLALGPLTNLALVLDRNADLLRGVGRVIAMGGAVDVRGNVTPEAEFNMHVDPDAARAVFDAGLPLELVPLDATRQAVLRRHELGAALATRPGPFADRIAAFTARGFTEQGADGIPGLTLHDPLAAGVAADASFVEWETMRLTIGDDGETRRAPGAPNCRVAMRVDRARFVSTVLDRLCPPP
jgi:inosine-uridine nucleoside N-ribohydrolase